MTSVSAVWAMSPRAGVVDELPPGFLQLQDNIESREQLHQGFAMDHWRHEFRDRAVERDFTRFFQPEWITRVVRMSTVWMVVATALAVRAQLDKASVLEVVVHYGVVVSLSVPVFSLRWIPNKVPQDAVVTTSLCVCVVLAATILYLDNKREQHDCDHDTTCLLNEAHAHGLAVGLFFCVLSVYAMIVNRKFVHFCIGIACVDATFVTYFVVLRPLGTGGFMFVLLMAMLTGGLGWWNRSLDRFLRKEYSWYVTQTTTTRTYLEHMDNAKRHKQRIVGYLFHEVRNPINNIVLATSSALEVLSDLRKHPLAMPDNEHGPKEGSENGEQASGEPNNSGNLPSLHDTVADLAELVGVMSTAARTATHVLDDALNLEQLEAGNFTFMYAPFTLSSLCTPTMKALVPQFTAKSIAIDLEVEECLEDLQVVGDVKRLRQVLHNFLSNAAKFTPPNGRVLVKASQLSRTEHPEEIELCISVSDTGVGISEADQQSLFQPWSQIRPAQQQGGGGTGLGLSLSKDFIQRGHNGRIGVRSPGELGAGSTFFFVVPLPVHHDDEGSSERRNSEPESNFVLSTPVASQGSCLAEVRVLVVDDSALTVRLFGRLLASLGVAFDSCENGKIAVEKVQESRYAIVFLDKEMPVMDGFEAARAIHKLDPRLPIVGVTGNALDEQRKEFLGAGASVVLPKPVNKTALVKILEQFDVLGAP